LLGYGEHGDEYDEKLKQDHKKFSNNVFPYYNLQTLNLHIDVPIRLSHKISFPSHSLPFFDVS